MSVHLFLAPSHTHTLSVTRIRASMEAGDLALGGDDVDETVWALWPVRQAEPRQACCVAGRLRHPTSSHFTSQPLSSDLEHSRTFMNVLLFS